jgi:hypothetical protein
MSASQKRKCGNTVAAAPCQDYRKRDYSKNSVWLKREVKISICLVAPPSVSKQEKRNKNAKRRKSKCEESREKEPEPGAVHCRDLLMFRDQKQQRFKDRERGGEDSQHST